MSPVLDAHVSGIAHAQHIIPIWKALPLDSVGAITTQVEATYSFLRSKGIDVQRGRPRGDGPLVLIASFQDAQVCYHRRRIYLEHGAGQHYGEACPKLAKNGSYSGGDGHAGTAAFLCPSQTVADRWAHYQVPRYVIGAPPYLDPYLTGDRTLIPTDPPTIAVTFHWDGRNLCPELASAFNYFVPALPALCKKYNVLGHGHPRVFANLADHWAQWGAEIVPSYDDILARAHAIVGDNTSSLYEMAALGRPVLCLDDPSWRRDISHGLRFYSHAPGIRCGDPRYLLSDLADTLAEDTYALGKRVLAVQAAYDGLTDGRSTDRAVNAVMEVLQRYGSR